MVVYLIVGSTGAGKTTYSKKLSAEKSAAVFSIDNFMKDLYWQDMPRNPDNSWFVENGPWYMERINRCEALILKMTVDRLQRSENTILDLGFSTDEHRMKFISELKKSAAEIEVHFLDYSAEVRWQRVLKRNSEKGETFAMTVDRNMFDYMESIFETPTAKEGVRIIHIR